MNETKTSTKQKLQAIKYVREHYTRIPLDVKKDYFAYLKEYTKERGLKLNTFIREAIEEKIARDATKENTPNGEANMKNE